jgi:hypothetical protein
MKVVLVVGRVLDDRGRTPESEALVDEDVLRAGSDEAVDKVLRERPIHMVRAGRCAQAPVAARVVDVHASRPFW